MNDAINCGCATDRVFTPEEIANIVKIKRFSEYYQADVAMRNRFAKDEGFTSAEKKWLKKIGVDINLEDLAFFWKDPTETFVYVMCITKGWDDKITAEAQAAADKYPLLKLWAQWSKSRCNIRIFIKGLGNIESSDVKFHAWRKRRMASAKSELGFFGIQIGHPAFAFELNRGCSVGCWFCSFATDKLTGTLDYPQNKEEVMNIIRQCGEMFGKDLIKMTLPYYRTEPHDNPHYIDFLKDFERETGGVLCTATACCNDTNWIGDLIEYYHKREDGQIYFWPRLSILSLGMLKKVHSSFTPLELKDVEMLIQVKDSGLQKVTGGRIFDEQAGLRGVEDFSGNREELLAVIPQGSISCVSGFCINLAEKTILVFSPCYTSEKWPHGFRVYGQTSYTDENDFGAAINELVERCMLMSPPPDKAVKFRDDIIYRPTESGYDLATANQLHHFKGKGKLALVGKLIAEGTRTYDELTEHLVNEHGLNPIILRTVVQQLFDDGFLCENYND